MLCTIADIKTRLGIGAEFDSILTPIVAGVTGLFETYCNRKFIVPAAAVTEYLRGGIDLIQVECYPIVAITSVKEVYAPDTDFEAAEALVADTDYRKLSGGKTGILQRLYLAWPDGLETVQVIYRGGYTAAGSTPGTGETAIPADLKEIAIQMACMLFKKRDEPVISGTGVSPGTASNPDPMELPPIVRVILDKYKRISL